MIFSSFTVRCEPCPAATNATGKADGEVRWITATGLPIFCRRRDMIARMLKPVGDLVYLAKSGAFFVGTCKAAVRIRRGRKLPTTVKYNALTEQFTIRIQLDRGEPPLPWDKPPETPTASSGAKGDGNQPVNSEKWCGPPGNNQKLQAEVTAEEMGFRRSPADAIACDAAQSVRTLAGYKGKEKVDIRSKTNMEIREFKEKTKEKENSQMGERRVEKNALMAPSHPGEKPRTRCRGDQENSSRLSRTEGHVEHCQPLPITHEANRVNQAEEREGGLTSPKAHVARRASTSINSTNVQTKDTGLHEPSKQMVSKNVPNKHVNDPNQDNAKELSKSTCNENSNANISSFPFYSEHGKDAEIESDESFDDQLIREIELEMEQMWNVDLDGEENKVEEREAIVDLTMINQNDTPSNIPTMNESTLGMKKLKDPEVTKEGCNEPMQVEPEPVASPQSSRPVDKQKPSPITLREQRPPNLDPGSEIDFSKYKWRHVNGIWNYMADSTWEDMMEKLEQGRLEPTENLGQSVKPTPTKKVVRQQKTHEATRRSERTRKPSPERL
ncbi:hypothetical protein J5N97_025640 [Dioscorea zingiberensis]|uniref:Uncharacterized protein n=1 Tax=Dioscorea zingiberensis TaxID=325984 RepID=A0A9D5H666_9LILI|nr:hypothetical protein J5N97_025640 [Dioscorea zingiberensis]